MTKVCAVSRGDSFAISAKGHATGSPETCAAISGIIYALAGYLENSSDKCHDVYIRLESADAELRFCGGEAAAAAFLQTVIGLCQLEAAKPTLISVELKEL